MVLQPRDFQLIKSASKMNFKKKKKKIIVEFWYLHLLNDGSPLRSIINCDSTANKSGHQRQSIPDSVASLISIPAETFAAHGLSVRKETEWRAKNKKAENTGIQGLRGDTTAGGGGTVSSANGIKLCQMESKHNTESRRDTTRGKSSVQAKQVQGRNPLLHLR